jgi:hypothetical protein
MKESSAGASAPVVIKSLEEKQRGNYQEKAPRQNDKA